jgi:hypothetical protein
MVGGNAPIGPAVARRLALEHRPTLWIEPVSSLFGAPPATLWSVGTRAYCSPLGHQITSRGRTFGVGCRRRVAEDFGRSPKRLAFARPAPRIQEQSHEGCNSTEV